jgi:MoaA/NifB/PqqE/SkfB family radical SAM enzyme
MSFWKNVSQLHLEISALCNSVCPCCPRYPTAGYDELPAINNSMVWTLSQVQEYLPADDIKHIRRYLINGTHGDFITNNNAIEILEYFYKSSPTAIIQVNTNGSARNTAWWTELAQRCAGRIEVYFALDGLNDTHHLYRRSTNWNTIIENAQAFTNAGGKSIWTMTLFKHNEHQKEQCLELSKKLGFYKFEARFNSREPTLALDKAGQPSHWITNATTSPFYNLPQSKDRYGYETRQLPESSISAIQQKRWIQIQQNSFVASQQSGGVELNESHCSSLKHVSGGHSVYINASWLVTPCCHISNTLLMQSLSRYHDNLQQAMQDNGITQQSITASNSNTVSSIVDRGFGWIYNTLPTSLAVCSHTCGPSGGLPMSLKTKDIKFTQEFESDATME